jgi:hypothetical protein
MAVTVAGAVEFERTLTTDPQTWSHNVGTSSPKGVIVAVVHGTSSTDHVLTVTYGGVSLTRIQRNTDTATEPGAAELWFLGSGVPTGTQTVSADLASATTDDIHFVSITLDAADDLEVVSKGGINENAANPSVTLAYAGRTCMSFAAFYGGGASPAAFTENANCTRVADFAIAAFYSVVLRQTTAGSTDFAIGGTASSDDVAFAAIAVSEVQKITPPAGSLALTGGTPGVPKDTPVSPLVGALALAGNAPVLDRGIVPAVGTLTLTGAAPTFGSGVTNTDITPLAGELFFGVASQELTPSRGTLALTPGTAKQDHGTIPAGGALTLTGAAPTVQGGAGTFITPLVGSLALTGQQPTAKVEVFITPLVVALNLSGQVPTVSEGKFRTPQVGALALVGNTSMAVAGTVITPLAGSLGLTGATPRSDTGTRPSVGTLTLTGQAPVVAVGPIITPLVGALTFTGQAPTLRLAIFIAPPTGSAVLIGDTPGVSRGTILTPLQTVGSLVLTGNQPSAVQSRVITPLAGALAVTGNTPKQDIGTRPVAGALTLTGNIPQTGGNVAIQPTAGAMAVTGGTSVRIINVIISPSAATLAAIGAVSTVIGTDDHFITTLEGALTLDGGIPGITSAQFIPTMPPGGTRGGRRYTRRPRELAGSYSGSHLSRYPEVP